MALINIKYKDIKKDLFKIVEKVKSNKEKKPKNNDKNYFG